MVYKRGVEPWRFQKRFNSSHVQVSLLLYSLSPPPLALFCFCCLYYYYYYYYVYLLAKGFIITVVKETNLVLSIAMINNTNLDILLVKLIPFLWFLLSLYLFPNGHCMCAGYLTHTISPAGLVALHRCRLSHLYNINSLAFSFHSLLSLFPNGHCMCAGYLTYTILPAGLVALHRCRLSHLYNINSLAFSFHSLLSLPK